MGGYIPGTKEERQQMVESLGLNRVEELFSAVPQDLLLEKLALPQGLSELSLRRHMEGLANKNTVYRSAFRGAGAYRHYIPAAVKTIAGKERFLTAYTPYQPEISQGILQSIFEYQTMICELTGMDVSNASVYDGASAAAEAACACAERGRNAILVAESAPPVVRQVIETYAFGADLTVRTLPSVDGTTDLAVLKEMLAAEDLACVYVQQPNYWGLIEDCEEIGKILADSPAKFIMGVNPIAMALLRSPGDCGADFAVGEGQPLGLVTAFGGPYLGFMAASQKMARKLPGRIVGETLDADGARAFVLTLQAREQHIRREKASSNICSNQAHCALTAAAYMAVMGPEGLKQAAQASASKAHYLAGELEKIGYRGRYAGEFFHEFLTETPASYEKAKPEMEKRGILGPLPVEGGLLWCTTEMNGKDDIDEVLTILQNAAKEG